MAGGLGGAVLLGGCGVGSGSGSDGKPKKGGTVRTVFTTAGSKETIDPHVGIEFVDMARIKAVYDKLVDLDADLRPVPRLATDWKANGDSTVWRFTLRKATFHDGHQLEPEDVLFSLDRILGGKSAEHPAKATLTGIDLKRSRAVGKHAVEIVLKHPNADLPSLLGGTGTAIVRRGFKDPSKPVGTGPFRYVSFSPGRSFTARRFDDHWDGAPYPDEIQINSAKSEARASSVQSGEVEYAHEMTPAFARTVQANQNVRIVAAHASTTEGFVMKTDRPPFDDPDAAMAVKLLTDRKRFLKTMFDDRAVLGNDMYGRGYEYYPSDVPQREHDVAEARKLLRKSGALNKKVTCYTSTVADGFVDAAHLLAKQAGEAGLRVNVTTGPPETYYTDEVTTGQICNHQVGPLTIPTYINRWLLSDSGQNMTAWRHKDFDQDFHEAQSTTDRDKRTERYGKLQRTVRDKGGLLAFGHADALSAVTPKLHGVKAVPPNTVDWARFDNVWVD